MVWSGLAEERRPSQKLLLPVSCPVLPANRLLTARKFPLSPFRLWSGPSHRHRRRLLLLRVPLLPRLLLLLGRSQLRVAYPFFLSIISLFIRLGIYPTRILRITQQASKAARSPARRRHEEDLRRQEEQGSAAHYPGRNRQSMYHPPPTYFLHCISINPIQSLQIHSLRYNNQIDSSFLARRSPSAATPSMKRSRSSTPNSRATRSRSRRRAQAPRRRPSRHEP